MSDPKEALTEDVVVTRPFVGLLYMQVCAYGEVPPERVQERANELNPAGTSNGWFVITEDSTDHPGQGPVPCEQDRARLHWMLNC
jgi:hypothetical protein